jgi:multisubunit Na+/H+ antiporter MnhC subunit
MNLELAAFLAILAGMGVYDLKKMKKANLKKEIVPYISLSLLSAAVALLFFLNPDAPSLAKLLMTLFGVKE